MPKRTRAWLFGTMLVASLVALAASFWLSVEEFTLLRHPDAVLTCSINAVLNCASVMQTWQASLLGFPNMFIGLMAFPVFIFLSILGVYNVNLPRWLWQAGTIGAVAAASFAYWLYFSSLYSIGILCPWCLAVTASSTVIAAAMVHHAILANTFGLGGVAQARVAGFVRAGYGVALVVAWCVALVALAILRFGADLFA